MQFLLGTVAHNQHVRNIAGALFDCGMLAEFRSFGLDVWKHPASAAVRRLAGRAYPALDGKLARRRVSEVDPALVSSTWSWEVPRLAADRLGRELLKDWVWEHGELSLDRSCALRMERPGYGGFIGVEHGALAAIRRCRELGKPSVVAFLSPHHATRASWVDVEYNSFPQLRTPTAQRLLDKARLRDERRDQEAEEADIIHCASSFTRQSLIEAGCDATKIMINPLGCPPVVANDLHLQLPSAPVRFVYCGSVSVHKGAHILLEAWRRLKVRRSAELHFYGVVNLPPALVESLPSGAYLHGPVSFQRISHEYLSASALVFPTLYDGFGMVIAEAFSHGLPVITTPNAGAVDFVREGENGWVVPPRDVDALASRLQSCIDSPELLSGMRESARETARQWTWLHFRDSFTRQLVEHLQRLGTVDLKVAV